MMESAHDAPAPAPPKTMFPLMLDVSTLPIMVIGGASMPSRIAAFDEHDAEHLHVFAVDPSPELSAAAGARMEKRWPEASDFERIRPTLVFIADIEDGQAAELRALARATGALVHVQDRIPLCDFHLPARVRRGHLQVTVSTDGTAAGLSRHIREYLEEHVFGPEWAERVDEVAAARRQWKREGLSFAELGKAVADLVKARGWLKRP